MSAIVNLDKLFDDYRVLQIERVARGSLRVIQASPMAPPHNTSLHELVGPAVPQALLLARYQALKSINKDVVEVDENDVINHKPLPEEERIMASNAAVVSALEDLFSWIDKDHNSRTSRLSYVESWRFHRAMYRVWIASTLYGYNSAPHGQHATGASPKIQNAFLQKFTSQDLVQMSKVCRFLQALASWVILAESRVVGSLDVYDFDGLYLFAGPHVILRCYEERSSDPLPFGYLGDDGIYEKFLLHRVEGILKQRKVDIPLGFVGSILDGVCGANDTCHACGRDGRIFVDIQCTSHLYNENNWERLKGDMGSLSEIFLKLSCNAVEKPLFKALYAADYDTFFHELFAHKGDRFKDWTTRDSVCVDCIRDFFRATVFLWWRKQKERGVTVDAFTLPVEEQTQQDCRHGYYCRDQCFDAGVDHAKRFNHACEPVDEIASLAHYHGR